MTQGLTARAVLVGAGFGLLVALPVRGAVGMAPMTAWFSPPGVRPEEPWILAIMVGACGLAALFLTHLAGALSVMRTDLSRDEARRVGAWTGVIVGLVAATLSWNYSFMFLGTVWLLDWPALQTLAASNSGATSVGIVGALIALDLLGTAAFTCGGALVGAWGATGRCGGRPERDQDQPRGTLSPWVWLVALAIGQLGLLAAQGTIWNALAMLVRPGWDAVNAFHGDALVAVAVAVAVTMAMAMLLAIVISVPAAWMGHQAGAAYARLDGRGLTVASGAWVCLALWSGILVATLVRHTISPVADGLAALWMGGWFLYGHRAVGPPHTGALSWRDVVVGGVLAWVVYMVIDALSLRFGVATSLVVAAHWDADMHPRTPDLRAIHDSIDDMVAALDQHVWSDAVEFGAIIVVGVVLAQVATYLASPPSPPPSGDASGASP